tara:strand:+ start:764 stop:976 length:213 start_codon:yes stop_codon:yes gene_type:complete
LSRKRQKKETMSFNNLTNKQLVDRINHLYENNKNDDDEIAELVKRRNNQGFSTKVIGEKFFLIERTENER